MMIDGRFWLLLLHERMHRADGWIEAEVDEWMRERITAIRSDAE